MAQSKAMQAEGGDVRTSAPVERPPDATGPGDTAMETVVREARRATPVGALPTELLPTAGRGAVPPRAVGVGLWAIQGLLALLFLFAGGLKLAVPPATLAAMSPLPVVFLRFIGVVEVLGGLGLVLPALTRIRPGLTPLAATGLALEMVGAVAATLATGGGAAAAFPLAVGLLAVLVAYGRGRVARLMARA